MLESEKENRDKFSMESMMLKDENKKLRILVMKLEKE
jgi:hypothetical protein